MNTSKVTRFEFIDQDGRLHIHHALSAVQLVLQDDGRTLKMFCHNAGSDTGDAWRCEDAT